MSDWISIGEPTFKLTPVQQRIWKLLQTGKSARQIGRIICMGEDFVREEIYEIRKWEAIMNKGKLNNSQRAAIYQAWKDGTSQAELARQYGVSDVSIHNLIKKLNAADQSIRSSDLPKPACEAAKIATENEQRIKAELEDCENGIPNTPLVPRKTQINPEFDAAVDEMIAESKSAITEKNSVNAEPQKIPLFKAGWRSIHEDNAEQPHGHTEADTRRGLQDPAVHDSAV